MPSDSQVFAMAYDRGIGIRDECLATTPSSPEPKPMPPQLSSSSPCHEPDKAQARKKERIGLRLRDGSSGKELPRVIDVVGIC